jgi:DNA-binding protein HU-beta
MGSTHNFTPTVTVFMRNIHVVIGGRSVIEYGQIGFVATSAVLLIIYTQTNHHKEEDRQMTKADLVAQVAETGLTKKQAAAAVDTVMDAIKKTLAKGEKVSLIGFGSLSVKKRKARTGRDPRTGKEIKIKAKTVPVFSAGKALKDAVS